MFARMQGSSIIFCYERCSYAIDITHRLRRPEPMSFSTPKARARLAHTPADRLDTGDTCFRHNAHASRSRSGCLLRFGDTESSSELAPFRLLMSRDMRCRCTQRLLDRSSTFHRDSQGLTKTRHLPLLKTDPRARRQTPPPSIISPAPVSSESLGACPRRSSYIEKRSILLLKRYHHNSQPYYIGLPVPRRQICSATGVLTFRAQR